MREKILLNKDWRFHAGDIVKDAPRVKGPMYMQAKTERVHIGAAAIGYNDATDDYRPKVEYNEALWENVTLPHDYIISQTPKKEENNALGFFHYHNAWYRRHFTFDESDRGRRIRLLFEGVATGATVYFNGSIIKRNYSAYTPFEADITDFIRFGEDNVLAVYVDGTSHEGWWYEGAGIYRDVYLLKTDPLFIDVDGIYAHAEPTGDENFRLHADVTVKNDDFVPREADMQVTLRDAEGQCVGQTTGHVTVEARSDKVASLAINVESPHLWDIDDPYRYQVTAVLTDGGEVIDEDAVKTGFRTFRIDPDEGFFLNGRHVKIKGVCMHQDCGLTGRAVPDNVQRYKIEMIKQMGANGYRTSHYMQSDAIMEALDDLGFIVMAETRWFDASEYGREQLSRMLRRNRSRPSVFFWSIGNEEPDFVTERGRSIAKVLRSEVEKWDKTRPVLMAVDRMLEKATVFDASDVGGINYHLSSFEPVHALWPKLPLLSSECCATGTTRGWYADDCPTKGYYSAFDKIAPAGATGEFSFGREDTWRFITERPWIMGSYQWIAFEHRGEAMWPRVCSQSGAIDLFLQKKDAFYQNQSHWSDQPMIHLLPHWNRPMTEEGELVTVWAYTNCDEAELFLNGTSLGRVSHRPYEHIEWQVPYAKGRLEAVGYQNGREVARDVKETSKKAVRLSLHLDNQVCANGRDVAIVTCTCLDEDGRCVPDAAPLVDFYTNALGRVIGTGSDVSDHHPVTDTTRKMRAGAIGVAVQVGESEGDLLLYAESEGLKPARLRISLRH